MKTYYGTKRIEATPALKEGVEGYEVVYADGYKSWSPKDVFEAAYQPTDAMSFGHAITALKDGKKVARAGWNGKGMWLYFIVKSHWETTRGLETLEGLPWIGMKTADDMFVPWLASQTDMLAQDWQIVEMP